MCGCGAKVWVLLSAARGTYIRGRLSNKTCVLQACETLLTMCVLLGTYVSRTCCGPPFFPIVRNILFFFSTKTLPLTVSISHSPPICVNTAAPSNPPLFTLLLAHTTYPSSPHPPTTIHRGQNKETID